jgi:putative two-component system response regulator
MSIIDVYDALISRRVYKQPFEYGFSIQAIKDQIGTHFDPDIAQGFLEIKDEIYASTLQYTQ